MVILGKQLIICDRKSKFRKEYVHQIQQLIKDKSLNITLNLVTDQAKEVISYLENRFLESIYIIDVNYLNPDDGIDLAKCIRMYDALGYIVFITSEEIDVSKVFRNKIQAMDYIKVTPEFEFRNRIQENLECINSKSMRAFV